MRVSRAIYGPLVNGTGAVCDQKTSKFFVSPERIHHRTHGYKRSLLKVREEKYEGKYGGVQMESGG
jgi:hypothetical protein